MYRNVDVSCVHCGDSNTVVGDAEAIPEVPATYEAAAANRHRQSVDHYFKRRGARTVHPSGEIERSPENIVGKLSEFTHGKEHNA